MAIFIPASCHAGSGGPSPTYTPVRGLDKALRGIVLFAAALAIWRFNGQQEWLYQAFQTYLPLFAPVANQLGEVAAVSEQIGRGSRRSRTQTG